MEINPHRMQINDHQYMENVRVKYLSNIESFYEQRDIDRTRLPKIIEVFKRDIERHNYLILDTPIIILIGEDLIDKKGNRVNKVVIDGQHRIAALKQLFSSNSKIGELRVPIMIHLVANIQSAREFQYRVFEQKPLDVCDKIRKGKYNITDMIDDFIAEFRQKHPNLAKRYLKEGRYEDQNRRPRKFHFLKEELKHYIRNSPNVEEWISREIQPSELLLAILNLQRDTFTKFNSLETTSEKMRMVNIKTTKNYESFLEMLRKNELGQFQILPYTYYKNYAQLVTDLEFDLGIEDDDDDDDECHSEDDYDECL